VDLICQKSYLDAVDIKDRWEILNIFLGALNSDRVDYKIWSSKDLPAKPKTATFYLHGFGGCLDDTPFIEDVICSHHPLIRVACSGVSGAFNSKINIGSATFGDVCAILHNSRQSVCTIADILRLESYSVVAHSWGGLVASLTALNDVRCNKAMLLVSTPDICDALTRMYKLIPAPEQVYPLFDLFMGKLRIEAELAKHGRSSYQKAWEDISPYGEIRNPGIQMLIFNRTEDCVMRRWNVEQFIAHAHERGIRGVRAEFNKYEDLTWWHDMPLEKFKEPMRRFLFEESD
jgi:pimeloyl-ACP methyl ester carboxylesterase